MANINNTEYIFAYYKCRRCGNLVCYPVEIGSDLGIRLINIADEDYLGITEEDHPYCNVLYPEHFTAYADLVYYTEDLPDKQLAKDTGYINKIDFTLFDQLMEEENDEDE